MMKIIKIFALFLFWLPLAVTNAQDRSTTGGRITILDSVVVKKYDDEAVKLNIQLEIPQRDSTILYHFNKFVNSSSEYLALKKWGKQPKNSGLIYIIEDEDGHYIDTWIRQGMISCDRVEDESRYYSSRWMVDTTKMKAFFSYIEDDALREDFDLAEIVVEGGAAVLSVYPVLLNNNMFSKNEIRPGKYKIFLFYSMHVEGGDSIMNEERPYTIAVFSGALLSNKVDLIVEDRPVKWWQFWRRKSK